MCVGSKALGRSAMVGNSRGSNPRLGQDAFMGDDDQISDIDRWRDADPLSSAWFQHAPEALKDQYRDSGTAAENRAATLQVMMEGEVQLRVARGDLIALGVATAPEIEGAPRQISPFLFEIGVSEIDWTEGVIVGLGRRFEHVRLAPTVQNSAGHEGRTRPVPETGDREAIDPNVFAPAVKRRATPTSPQVIPARPRAGDVGSTIPAERSRPGPKSAAKLIREAYAEFVASGRLRKPYTLKEVWVILGPELADAYPGVFPGSRGLSYKSFARHIRAKTVT